MTTLILQTAGKVIGGALAGPFGAMVGGALGASAGYLVDQHLFSSSSREGPRLSDLQIQASTEGADIPRAYGRTRLNGQLIWATNYVEKVNTRTERTGGGKSTGAPKHTVTQTTYSYFANFAVGLCEGEIGYIGRIWANGTLLDQEKITFRVYRGTQDQMPDSLIEAKQGAGMAPAYRGLAYIVFEELPLSDYGNRIPQLSFEIIKPVGSLEKQITSMVMIPGSTEFGYDTDHVKASIQEGQDQSQNKHNLEIGTDFVQSLDQLQATCPNLKRIALVVTWFGNDLRASHCSVEPRVDADQKTLSSGEDWSVAGVTRPNAAKVSEIDGRAAYGGTPSDGSVIRAIKEIHRRGLEVVLYPFMMMDIAPDNGLDNPYGEGKQPAHPWRGRLTCNPAPGTAGSADKTALVDGQLGHFFVSQTWSYRRFLHHYAQLAQQSGGVEAFLIGSELRGLTTCRNAANDYPAVGHLKTLAAEMRQILGASCKLTYGADWSEYFGHHPQNEGETVQFHLDPLWADPNIDAVGIDNYMPLSDWRESSDHLDASDAGSPYDMDYLQSRIMGGEGYDWYYKSDADRLAQIRTPITDGSHQKPWVYRYKDLINWWSEPHFNRNEGVEEALKTFWDPKSKPIWFTELGCASVHLASNQPNRFPDSKSSENALPFASNGARDDFAQRAMIEAVLSYWKDQNEERNPSSDTYSGKMLDADHCYLWAWDARPFPSFPMLSNICSDGNNWHAGHWMNGRLGAAPLNDLLCCMFEEYGLEKPNVLATSVSLDGFVIDRRMSARAAMEGLLQAFGLSIASSSDQILIQGAERRPALELERSIFVDQSDQPLQVNSMVADYDLPTSISFAYQDVMLDFRQIVARHDLGISHHKNDQALALSIVSNLGEMEKQAQRWMQRATHARHRLKLALPSSLSSLEAGDTLLLKEEGAKRRYLIEAIEDGEMREVDAILIPDQEFVPNASSRGELLTSNYGQSVGSSRPVVEVLDLPLLPDRSEFPHAPYIAAYAKPWPSSIQIFEGTSGEGFRLLQALQVPAIMGRLKQALAPAKPDRFYELDDLEISLLSGELASVAETTLFDGANAAAIKARNGMWEVIQFQQAELVAPKTWRLRRVLRGQLGTEQAAATGADQDARFVLLDEAVQPLSVSQSRLEQQIELRAVEQGSDIADPSSVAVTHTISGRALKPLAPVHISHEIDRESGDWTFSWIRRDRMNADSWVGEEIPLSEEKEAYQIEIWRDQSVPVLAIEQTTSEPKFVLSSENIASNGLSEAERIIFKVSQISSLIGKGAQNQEIFHV